MSCTSKYSSSSYQFFNNFLYYLIKKKENNLKLIKNDKLYFDGSVPIYFELKPFNNNKKN